MSLPNVPFLSDSYIVLAYQADGSGTVVLSASPDSYTVAENGTLTVSAPGVLANDTVDASAVATKDSDPAHGTLDSFSADGSFSYHPNAGFYGTDQFTYTVTQGDASAVAVPVTITVNPPAVTSVTVTAGSDSITAGSGEQLKAVANYADGTSADVTKTASWSSSDSAVATVDSLGYAVGAAAGTATITATAGGTVGTYELTVTKAPLQYIDVQPALTTVAAGTSVQYQAIGTYTDGSTSDLTSSVDWSSSDAAVAAITASGAATTLAVGSTVITAKDGSFTATGTLNVTAAALESISLAPPTVDLSTGQTQQYTAAGVYSDGTTKDISAEVSWSSSDDSIATVDGSGLATANAVGGATITATDGAVSGTAQLNVVHAAQTITITPDAQSITYGDHDPTFTYAVSYSGTDVLLTQPTCGVDAPHGAAGSYTITCTGATGPYNDEIVYNTATLTVKKGTVEITPANQSIDYGSPDPAFSYQVTGLVSGEELITEPTCGVSGPHSHAGTYPITCTGADAGSNYNVDESAAATLTVGKAAVVITPADQTITYGQADPAFTYQVTGLATGDKLTQEPTCTVAGNHSHAGTYLITCSGADAGADYSVDESATATLTVRKAPLSITAPSPSITYGVDASAIDLTPTTTGLVNGDTLDGLGGASCSPTATPTAGGSYAAGSYPVTCRLDKAPVDYAPSYTPGTLTVAKAQLTVTANSATRGYRSANPALTATVTGMVNGDTAAAAYSGAPALSTTATTDSDPGSYPITAAAGTLSSANYSFSFVPGTLVITKIPTMLTVSGALSSLLSGKLTATLTNADGEPLAGRTITFTAGSTALCAPSVTDANGVASCNVGLAAIGMLLTGVKIDPLAFLKAASAPISIVLGLGYSATFDGDTDYSPATATSNLLTLT